MKTASYSDKVRDIYKWKFDLDFNFQIKLADVVGTGKDGRVLKEDILNYLAHMRDADAPGKRTH